MGKSKDLATGETRFVNTSGDTMTGNLAITKSDASITPDADADDFVIEGNQAIGMTIGSSASSVGSIRFADSGSPRAGMLYYSHITNEMRLYTNATQHLTVNSSGIVTMPNQPAMSGRAIRPVDTGGYVTTGVNIYVDGGANLEVNNGNHWNNSTGVWTCPVAGRYFCYAAFLLDDNQGAGSLARYAFKKNGSEFFISYNHDKYGSSYGGMATAGGIFNCAANDTITCVVSHGQFHAGGESSMSIYLLG